MIFLRFFLGFAVQILPCAFLCFYFFQAEFTRKRIIRFFVYFLLLAVVFAGISVRIVKYEPDSYIGSGMVQGLFMIMLLGFGVYYVKFVKKPFWLKVFVLLYFINIAFILTQTVNIVLCVWYKETGTDVYPYYGICIPVLTIMTLALLPVFYTILSRYLYPVMGAIDNKTWKLLSVFDFGFLILTAIVSLVFDDAAIVRPENIILTAAFFFAELTSYYFVFRFINMYIEKNLAESREVLIQQEISLQKMQYEQMQSTISMFSRTRHDFRHHILLLKQMNSEKKYKEMDAYMEKYMNQYLKPSADMGVGHVSENYIVDTFIRYYLQITLRDGIAFTWKINFEEKNMPKDTDLTVILGNLMENACHACREMTTGDPFIRLIISEINGWLIIAVDNSMEEKQGGTAEAGIGIQSIQDTAKKYQGFCFFEPGQDVYRASVSLRPVEAE